MDVYLLQHISHAGNADGVHRQDGQVRTAAVVDLSPWSGHLLCRMSIPAAGMRSRVELRGDAGAASAVL